MNLFKDAIFSLFVAYCAFVGIWGSLPMPPITTSNLTPDSYVCFAPPSGLLSVLREGTALDNLPDSLTTMNLKDLRMLIVDN